jgi:hypothetical protein
MKTFRVLLLVALAGCAVRLGGPGPVTYDTVAIQFEDGVSVTDAAARLTEWSTDLALVVTRQDTSWVRQLAQQLQLISTRPGKAGEYTVAFLGLKPIGDTTLTLPVRGGGGVRLHDALFNVDKVKKPTDPSRQLDLMLAVLEPGTNARLAVDTLLHYIASDVGGTAAVILGVQVPNQAVGDSIATLTRAYIADTWECTESGRSNQPAPALGIRLFYFPAVRVRCETARVIETANRPAVARLIVP